jgi:hypothetical protein
MLAFRSEAHAAAWYERQGAPPGATMTLQQQWDLARVWYADRMSPQWRRPTPEEAEDVFAGVGLTGPFWRLRAATD